MGGDPLVAAKVDRTDVLDRRRILSELAVLEQSLTIVKQIAAPLEVDRPKRMSRKSKTGQS